MKKNITWIILGGLLIALIAGAAALYNRLGDDYRMDQLATQQPIPEETKASSTPTEAPEQETQPTEAVDEETAPEPQMAPDFKVLDAQGNEVKLSDFFGKPIVLNFWASWCGPCKMEMPDFDEKYLALGDKVTFLMVNMTDGSRETLDTAQTFVAESGFRFPVYYDVNYEAAMTYGVASLPTTYFIGADGALVAYAMGAIDADTLQQGIDMIYQDNTEKQDAS